MNRILTDAIRRASPVAMVVAVLLVSGCVAFEDNVQQGYSRSKDFGEGGTITFTTADVRTVIERKRVRESGKHQPKEKITVKTQTATRNKGSSVANRARIRRWRSPC
ncbi:hypothetical protein [Magnetospirillum fulvum]|nr:hypothetical protein [Magnetospirillum fulvum]